MSNRRPLRVHLIHQGFADYVGGLVDGLVQPERVLGERRQEIKPGVDVGEAIDLRVTTLLSGKSAGVQLRDVPVDHQTVSLPRFRDPRSLPQALLALRRILAEPCDVVHWQAAGNPWVDAAFRALMGSHPTVVTVHDMQPHPGDRNTLPGTFRALGAVARRAERVIVHAPHIRQQGIDLGILSDQLRILPHGELASRYLAPDQLPLPFGPEAESGADPVVLFFGRAQGYKGLDVLGQAMPEVARRVPGARLVVAGAGPTLDEVFPPGQPIPPWLKVVRGRIDDPGVISAFGQATIVALPYLEASQSGVAALAAGFGRPVVASAVPGLSDIVDDGVSGVLVESGSSAALAEGLTQLLSAPERVRALAQGSFALAAGPLSWEAIGAQTIEIYHEALRSWAGSGSGSETGRGHGGAEQAGSQ